MRPILRGAAAGLLAGAALYFFPFFFRFVFFIVLVYLMIRLFRGGGWGRRHRFARAGRPPFYLHDPYYPDEPLSIDGRQQASGYNQGPVQHIPIQ